MVRSNMISNCHITPLDVKAANNIFSPDIASLKEEKKSKYPRTSRNGIRENPKVNHRIKQRCDPNCGYFVCQKKILHDQHSKEAQVYHDRIPTSMN
jgi:hypothetical protein